MNCDWCFRMNQTINHAQFIAVTATVKDMRVTDWVICASHANILCNKRIQYTLTVVEGVDVDLFELDVINDQVMKYYRQARR